jgi:hypothetical protein
MQIQQKQDFKYRIDARLQSLYLSLRASSGVHLDQSWGEISSLSDNKLNPVMTIWSGPRSEVSVRADSDDCVISSIK